MTRLLAILLVLATPLVSEACRRCGRSSCHGCNVVVRSFTPVRFVERFIETPVTYNVFNSVGAGVREYAMAPPFVALAQQGQIRRQIDRLQDQLAEYTAFSQQYASYAPQQFAPAPMQYAPQYAPPQQRSAPPQYAPPQQQFSAPPQRRQVLAECPGPQTASNQYDMGQAQQQRVTDQRCIECHNSQKAEGDLNMEGPRTFDQRLHGLQKALRGEMPKGGPPLDREELRQFIQEEFSPEEQEAVRWAFGAGGLQNGSNGMQPPGGGQQEQQLPPQNGQNHVPPPEE